MMNARHIGTAALLAALALALAAPPARAATKSELKRRFAARFPALSRLKAAGQVGETDAGYVEARVRLPKRRDVQLLAAENADRTTLYQIIARETGTNAAAVGRRNGLRNWQKAKPGEWYKKQGNWIRKR